jgi:hypothetical protein
LFVFLVCSAVSPLKSDMLVDLAIMLSQFNFLQAGVSACPELLACTFGLLVLHPVLATQGTAGPAYCGTYVHVFNLPDQAVMVGCGVAAIPLPRVCEIEDTRNSSPEATRRRSKNQITLSAGGRPLG